MPVWYYQSEDLCQLLRIGFESSFLYPVWLIFLTFLQRSLYSRTCSSEIFLFSLSLRFSSASFSVSSEIQALRLVFLAGMVDSAAFLIALPICEACSSRSFVVVMFSMFLSSTVLYNRFIFSSFNRLTSTLQLCCDLLDNFLSRSFMLHRTNEWSELISAALKRSTVDDRCFPSVLDENQVDHIPMNTIW